MCKLDVTGWSMVPITKHIYTFAFMSANVHKIPITTIQAVYKKNIKNAQTTH